jgi:serine/threonine protein kinase/tetratricopeptide (TPR) repeat protein
MPLDSKRVQAVFLAAAEAADRAAVLARECGEDVELRRRVEALLHAYGAPGTTPDQPAIAEEAPSASVPGRWINPGDASQGMEGPGSRIGPYKLLQQLGEGGMGAVYMAEQEQPVKRRVALKIIKAGMDSARVIARFEQERQALAMMDHPHIAKVLEGGTTQSGRPYFVMELVKGIPITKFCDQEHLTPKERLELFIPVCQAVQHAHQKGIIHRDLKPSNVLIALYDGKPVPKVIDFGVAKAMGQKLTERTMFTEVGQIVGTLEYMAPEQAELNNLDIDTRADIYSLGVLLYELLTGTPPFTAKELRSAGFTEMLRIIRESQPPKPSTRLSGSDELPAIAAKRKLEPAKLAKLLRGDLDWIVLKCLEKERGRRYETANGLAMDVQRYLADEPVLASPPSKRYRLSKFLRKHRGPVLAGTIIAVLLVGGIVGTSLGFLRAERLRGVAEERESEALDEKAKAEASQRQAMEALRATTDDVVQQLIGAKPQLSVVERQFLENTLKRWQAFAAKQGQGESAQAVRAEGTDRVALLRSKLGLGEQAIDGYREAIALREKLVADFPAMPQHRRMLAQSHNNLGVVLQDLGRHAEAEAAYGRALTLRDELATEFPTEPEYRADLALSHNNLGSVLRRLGRHAEAEAAHRRALALRDELATEVPTEPEYRADLALSHHNLGVVLRNLGRHAEGEVAYRQALTLQDKLAAEFPAVPRYRANLADSHQSLGDVLWRRGKRAEAEASFRRAGILWDKLATEFPAVPGYREGLARSHNAVGVVLMQLGRRAEAEAPLRQGLAVEDKLAAEFPAVPQYRVTLAMNHSNLGILLTELGRWDEAEKEHRAALALKERLLEESPGLEEYIRGLAGTFIDLGKLMRERGRPKEALAHYDRAEPLLKDLLAKEPRLERARYFLRDVHSFRAHALESLGRQGEAAPEWGRAVELEQGAEQPYFQLRQALALGDRSRALVEAHTLAASRSVPGPTLYEAAQACAKAMTTATDDAKLTEQLADEVLSLLRRLVQLGYFKDPFNLKHLKEDSELKALWSRSEFQALLKELEPPADAKPRGR